jgi:hypothetical protein
MSSLSLKTLDDQRSVPGIPRRVICYALIYLVAVSFVVVVFLNQSVPVYGFRWMPRFGSHFEPQRSKEFRTKAGYVVSSKFGYDGQFYAQLATDPLIRNPETLTAFDNFGYRARRPLFAMTAYVAGGGEPKGGSSGLFRSEHCLLAHTGRGFAILASSNFLAKYLPLFGDPLFHRPGW